MYQGEEMCSPFHQERLPKQNTFTRCTMFRTNLVLEAVSYTHLLRLLGSSIITTAEWGVSYHCGTTYLYHSQ